MKRTNYPQVYSKVTECLSEKEKEIVSQRFGINEENPQTLEKIGKKSGVTRERIRQIINKAFSEIEKNNKKFLKEVFKNFEDYFKKSGGLKREDLVLFDLGEKKFQPHVLFLLNLGKSFFRIYEKEDTFAFWATDKKLLEKTKKDISVLKKRFEKLAKPQEKKEFILSFKKNKEYINSLIEISKDIRENKEGKIGLIKWAEINPKGIKDKSYLVLQKEKKPLHFREVAQLISRNGYNSNKKALPQTVHNELIKDSRFVLVGRGTYALERWGYAPGTVRDVISKVIKESGKPLTEKEIVEKVLKQRFVAKNTVLINLHNPRFFKESDKNKGYTLRDVQTA